MSWELVRRLRERFPQVEPFPHEEADAPPPAGEGAPPPPAAPAPGRPAPTRLPPKPRAEEKGPVFLTPGAWVPAQDLLAVCRFLRDDPAFRMDYLSWVTGVDWPQRGELEVVYHLFSFTHGHELLLKVRVPRDAARVPSVTPIWDGANWHEREAYDLLGIVFEGHPDLRRIMMTEDWVGHPLRKDYVYEDPPWLVEVARLRQQEIEGFGLGERA
ncbi:MAG: NADH-quinone oxidoreductase subunit C [Armatimonadota bacterium]|nr:NADH-quinone oxidoreductase subunit C [Armatimonadota bacterium]MDR7458631.1 NADH-quinone oxidoreductase subunit C [Armatimonadota bacterium]MDR7479540.1 NADH-quinone oxidoreductase subunit C [Armatimonadota bacterium]MDR7489310.1 NADH-quinone oxidoreductase subunit C [Armatimonadota bacterium]MDR7490513.1 NADH-quinone oxidoreductase subunit C [Armatimonadota bacterium]